MGAEITLKNNWQRVGSNRRPRAYESLDPLRLLNNLSVTEISELSKFGKVDNTRDKAFIALFTESGLRLSELAGIKAQDIDWETGTVKIMGKGREEALALIRKGESAYRLEWYFLADNLNTL